MEVFESFGIISCLEKKKVILDHLIIENDDHQEKRKSALKEKLFPLKYFPLNHFMKLLFFFETNPYIVIAFSVSFFFNICYKLN